MELPQVIKIKNRFKENPKVNYTNFDLLTDIQVNNDYLFDLSINIPDNLYIKNKVLNYAIYLYLNENKSSFKTGKNMIVPEVSFKYTGRPLLIAYSKSTRSEHIDHRIRVNMTFNTLSTGFGCTNQSTQNYIFDEKGIRYLTVNECESLQGYSVNHTQYAVIDGIKTLLSNTQRYKLCGNGISSPVAKSIIENFIKPEEKIKVGSLFSGCSGSELLLNKSFFETIYHVEFDKYASGNLMFNYPDIPNYGDITKLNIDKMPDVDLLIGGFPCQSWSIAGLRAGFDDKNRGQLIYNVFDIIRHKKMKYIVLENVKGLLSHNSGNSFEAICEGLSSLGYDIDFYLLNSKDFGLPQSRERVFILGKRKDG